MRVGEESTEKPLGVIYVTGSGNSICDSGILDARKRAAIHERLSTIEPTEA